MAVTVAELMKKLEKMPKDATVLLEIPEKSYWYSCEMDENICLNEFGEVIISMVEEEVTMDFL